MRVLRKLAALGFLVSTLGFAGEVRADVDVALDLERAKNSYDAGRYEEGVERFRALLENDEVVIENPEELLRARAYYAACLIAVGKVSEADRQLELVLRDHPAWRPDPVIFPGRLVDRFTAVRLRIQADLEAQALAEQRAQEEARLRQAEYIRSLENLAREEVVIERRSRFVATLPFGVGQFQNDQPVLGTTFLVGQGIAAGVSLASLFAYHAKAAEASRAKESDRAAFNEDLRNLRMQTNVSLAVFAGLAVGGILHAHLTFEPEVRTVRERPLPKPPTGRPVATYVPGGAVVGMSGTF